MRIYIDEEFRCHTTNPDGIFREFDAPPFFDGKCTTFVEGHRYVPENEIYTRDDGIEFSDEMISPWKPVEELYAAQDQYEADMAEAAAAYQEGVDSAYDQ